MHFGSLHFLWMLVLLPVVMILFRYGSRARAHASERFARADQFKELARGVDPFQAFVKKLLLLGALSCLVLSLTQPKWGFHWEEIKRKGIDIVVALDLSKSMLAEDIKPNRLTRAKMEVKQMINVLQGDRIGIVGFAGSSFIHCPLTLDYATAKMFLDAMDTDMIPEPGTDIGGALQRALSAFEGADKQHRVLILITDGEDHEATVMKVVENAQKENVTIYTIGVGSQTGAPIPIVDESGNKSYLKDRKGNIVVTKADSELLQKVALMTGGKKGNLSGSSFPLEEIYQNELSKMEKKELGSTRKKKFENRYQYPLGIALLLLVLECLIPGTRRQKEDGA